MKRENAKEAIIACGLPLNDFGGFYLNASTPMRRKVGCQQVG